MSYRASWRHERILRGPQKEDRPSPGAGYGKERGSPHLLRLALLHKTLRHTSRGGWLARAQEEARIRSEAGRESDEALGGRPHRAPVCEPSGTLRVHRSHHGSLGKSLDDVPRHSPLRPHQEKGGRSATERDGFLRAAWRVMVAATVAPERLVFLRTNAVRTPRWRRSTATRPGASDCALGCLASGARTPRCYRA